MTTPKKTDLPVVQETIQEKDPRQMSVGELLGSQYLRKEVSALLPTLLRGQEDRFASIMLEACKSNTRLLDCSPVSIIAVMRKSAKTGLEIDGRHAYVVPYNSKDGSVAEFIPSYMGLLKLVLNSPEIADCSAHIVCENDIFDEDKGDVITHKVDRRKPRGEVYALYARARFKDGRPDKYEIMDASDVKAIQARSKAVIAAKKYGKETPWDTDWNEMARKTVFKRLTKWLPLTYQAAKAIEFDNEREFGSRTVGGQPVAISDAPQPPSTQALNEKLKAPRRPKQTPATDTVDVPSEPESVATQPDDGDDPDPDGDL